MRSGRGGLAAMAVVGLLAGAALAGGEGDEDDLLELTLVVEKNDAASKRAARQQGAEQALAAMTDVDFLVPAARRAEVLEKLAGLFKDERVKERGGKSRWLATLSRSKARDVVLDVAAPEETYAKEPVGLVVEPGPASGWGPAELEVARATASDVLRTYRFKLAADAKAAPAVFTLKGGAEAAPHPADKNSLLVRPVAIAARFYHRASDTIVADFELRPGRGTPSGPVRPGEVNPRTCAPAAEKQHREALAREAARSAVMAMLKRVAGGAPAGGAPAAGGARPGGALEAARSEYELRLTGFAADVRERVLQALVQEKGFGNFREAGAQGATAVFRCTFQGDGIEGRIQQVLARLKEAADVARSGNVITVTRKG